MFVNKLQLGTNVVYGRFQVDSGLSNAQVISIICIIKIYKISQIQCRLSISISYRSWFASAIALKVKSAYFQFRMIYTIINAP